MPFMKGIAPMRRTWDFLNKGDIIFKSSIQIMTINYNVDQQSSSGAYQFAFWELPRLKYKNPMVQFLKFKNMTPTPYIMFYFRDGQKMLVDVYGQSRADIHKHLKDTFCKTHDHLQTIEYEKEMLNPSGFGKKYPRQCICEVPGQVPCPSYVGLPKYMKGIKKKYPDPEDKDS